jgi:hypothetical protein
VGENGSGPVLMLKLSEIIEDVEPLGYIISVFQVYVSVVISMYVIINACNIRLYIGSTKCM